MDPLSVAASIVALLQSAGAVIGFLSDLRDSPTEIRRIRVEVSSVLGLLITLQDHANQATKDDAYSSTLNSLNVVDGPFQQLHSALERLASKLAPVQGWKKIGKAFKWPLEKEEMQEILDTVERLATYLSLARQNDHIALSKAIKSDTESMRQKVDALGTGFANFQIDQRHGSIRRWLSAPDPSFNYTQALKDRHGATGDWFLTSNAYKNWLSDSGSLLWLYGIPGCGKTILSSTIIQSTVKYCESRVNSVVLYFYFAFNDVEKQQHEKMIRSLICQLLVHYPRSPPVLDALYASCMNGDRQPNLERLLPTLQQMMTAFGEVFIILDALDECGDRTELLVDLKEICDWTDVNCRMLVLSRRERDIEDGLLSLIKRREALCIQSALVDADIRQYIHDRLWTDRKLRRWQEEQSDIEDALMRKANGMFRWAVCQLDALCSCRSVLRLREALGSLPETLDKTYDRILCKINTEDYQCAFQILRWLSFSARPLCLAEVAEVIAIDANDSLYVDTSKRFKDPFDILEICSSLVSVEDSDNLPSIDSRTDTYSDADVYADIEDSSIIDTDINKTSQKDEQQSETTIRLAHFSVKEYLVSDRIRHGPALKYSLEEADSNASIAEDCLAYLLHVIQPTRWTSVSLGEYHLARYAAEYWFKHIRFTESTPHIAFTLIQQLFLSREETFVNWTRLYDPDFRDGWLPSDSSETDQDIGTPLYYASLLGLLESVDARLEAGDDVNATGGMEGNALQVASVSGHLHVVQLLLDNGANVNARNDGSHTTALEAASSEGHIEIVQLLLDKGAKINVYGLFSSNNALAAASMGGHIEIAKLLLEKGAFINFRRREGPLVNALSAGQESTALLLIENGADVSDRRSRRKSNLLIESVTRCESISLVQVLLDKGADINAPGPFYGSALEAACDHQSKNCEKVIRLLLAKGATINPRILRAAPRKGNKNVLQMLYDYGGNLNQTDSEGKTVCHYASARGDMRVLELLRSYGSDLTVIDKQGRNCLHFASASNSDREPGVITQLLNLGFDPNSPDYNGWTPLHWAARGGDVRKIAILEDAGAIFSTEAINGWTPDDVATFHHREIIWHKNVIVDPKEESGESHLVDCMGCNKGVYGSRFRCMDCADFDYCFKCKQSSEMTHPGHKFIVNPTSFQRNFLPYCSGCSANIHESRYKCLDCDDFDYCMKCKPSSDETHPGHRFIKDPTPDQLRELWGEHNAAYALEFDLKGADSLTETEEL